MALPKWTEERTATLAAFVGDESPVSQSTVSEAADQLETSPRSISSKLRKMGVEVELASSTATRAYSEAQESTLAAFVSDNAGEYTYAEIAANFEGGAFSAKSIQGKLLSMELTGSVKPTEKVVAVRTYSPEEEEIFIKMVQAEEFVEAIADSLGRSINSIRGKALSLLRAGVIDGIPKQETTKGSTKTDPLAALSDIAGMTVEAIAEAIEKTPRGVKTMLTRRGIKVSDYDGAAKKEKTANQ